jgi:hypothetical protein
LLFRIVIEDHIIREGHHTAIQHAVKAKELLNGLKSNHEFSAQEESMFGTRVDLIRRQRRYHEVNNIKFNASTLMKFNGPEQAGTDTNQIDIKIPPIPISPTPQSGRSCRSFRFYDDTKSSLGHRTNRTSQDADSPYKSNSSSPKPSDLVNLKDNPQASEVHLTEKVVVERNPVLKTLSFLKCAQFLGILLEQHKGLQQQMAFIARRYSSALSEFQLLYRSRLLKIKELRRARAAVVITNYFVSLRYRKRLHRKREACDLIRLFLTQHKPKSVHYNLKLRRFYKRVIQCQRFVRSFFECTKARVSCLQLKGLFV